MIYILRKRTDHDGWTLMHGGLAVAGGSFYHCIGRFFDKKGKALFIRD